MKKQKRNFSRFVRTKVHLIRKGERLKFEGVFSNITFVNTIYQKEAKVVRLSPIL